MEYLICFPKRDSSKYFKFMAIRLGVCSLQRPITNQEKIKSICTFISRKKVTLAVKHEIHFLFLI